ncbi:hypothetical protein K488DRAFT_8226, partial [Vararia minispora EC-137]
IILWRVFTVWPRSLIVRWIAILLYACTVADQLLATAVASIAVTWSHLEIAPVFIAFSASSLACNTWATVVIAYKAWYGGRRYRMLIRNHVVIVSRWSALEKMLGLLTESGILYCALWV